jgi:hypothetical protein
MGLPTPTTTTRVLMPLVQLPATTLQSVRSIFMAQQLLLPSDHHHHHTELHNFKSIHDMVLLSSSFQFQYCQQIQLLPSSTTVAFNQIPLETDQETGIF